MLLQINFNSGLTLGSVLVYVFTIEHKNIIEYFIYFLGSMSTNKIKSNNHVKWTMSFTDKSCLGFMSQSLFGMHDGVPQQTIDSNLRK